MARELFGEDVETKPVRREWEVDPSAKFLILPIPFGVDERIRQRVNRGRKTQNLIQETTEQATNRLRAIALARAEYALVDSVGFEVVTRSPKHAEELSAALGDEAPVKPGQFVKLDGKWTPAVKAAYFAMDPEFVAWVSDQGGELAQTVIVERETERGKT